jgi:hypothetical protein
MEDNEFLEIIRNCSNCKWKIINPNGTITYCKKWNRIQFQEGNNPNIIKCVLHEWYD